MLKSDRVAEPTSGNAEAHPYLQRDLHRTAYRPAEADPDRCRCRAEFAARSETCRSALRWIVRDAADGDAIADRLIDEFGSLPAVMAASADRWSGIAGSVAAQGLASFRHTVRHLLAYRFAQQPVLADWQGLLDYLRIDMAYLVTERVRLLHLNTKNMLIRDEVLAEGTIDRAAIHSREVIRRAIEVGSAAIILVHNHPSGDPAPSATDIVVTRRIDGLCRELGIALIDHLIVGRPKIISLRAEGHFA